jgi:septum formation protein
MIEKINNTYSITLGSGSPRRQNLLKDLGLDFKVETLPTDESYPEYLSAKQVAEHIAENKAAAFPLPKKNALIITADTIVAVDNLILGKPTDSHDARQMLQLLSGNTHEVITGVCIRSAAKTHIFSATTKVTFDQLTPEFIADYIEKYKPFDKAGAYGIQEWFGLVAVTHIEGSFFNVMGLPVLQGIIKYC